MVYQQFINYPALTVFENIASPLRVAGASAAPRSARACARPPRILQLEAAPRTRMPRELSGGQQQRTAIARALVKRAELVLLDEPLANLDYKLREELREELPRIFAKSGARPRLRHHRAAEALLLGGATVDAVAGPAHPIGPTAEVYRRPRRSTRRRSSPIRPERARRREARRPRHLGEWPADARRRRCSAFRRAYRLLPRRWVTLARPMRMR